MSERTGLSFKNKEFRIWFYIAVPYLIIGSFFLFIGGPTYNYVP